MLNPLENQNSNSLSEDTGREFVSSDPKTFNHKMKNELYIMMMMILLLLIIIIWKPEEELRLYRPHRCSTRLEYLEESWRPEETCCNSNSSEKPPVKTGENNKQKVK